MEDRVTITRVEGHNEAVDITGSTEQEIDFDLKPSADTAPEPVLTRREKLRKQFPVGYSFKPHSSVRSCARRLRQLGAGQIGGEMITPEARQLAERMRFAHAVQEARQACGQRRFVDLTYVGHPINSTPEPGRLRLFEAVAELEQWVLYLYPFSAGAPVEHGAVEDELGRTFTTAPKPNGDVRG